MLAPNFLQRSRVLQQATASQAVIAPWNYSQFQGSINARLQIRNVTGVLFLSKTLINWLDQIAPWRSRAPSGHSVLTACAMLTLLLALTGCSSLPQEEGKVEEEVAILVEEAPAIFESGLASFYGDRHHNQKTASGERYRHELKTAAHRTLPLGSYVKVTNQKTGRSVLVRINDRGPFARGRIIDLSKSAFAEIGNTASGLLHVDVQVIE
tara:strand:- start:84941 stop:85570 length:630 start_codon:yes stop_codon:yes gene_type:complete